MWRLIRALDDNSFKDLFVEAAFRQVQRKGLSLSRFFCLIFEAILITSEFNMSQNIYDNQAFFDGYAQLPRSQFGLEAAPE